MEGAWVGLRTFRWSLVVELPLFVSRRGEVMSGIRVAEACGVLKADFLFEPEVGTSEGTLI